MASLDSYLPAAGRAVWCRDRQPEYVREAQTVRHVVIRATNVVADPSPHVVYRIDVLTEHSHWYIGRRYNDFLSLHQKLVKKHHISRDLLPPKRFSGNFSHEFITARREQLEQYLQKLINSEHQVSHSKELQWFLDVPSNDVFRVTNLLARQLYGIGDQLLAENRPIALTINDLHCITKRLQLPMDQTGSEWASDLGHLYSFLHQIKSLKVILPPMPSSVTRMAFEVIPFRSLEVLKVDSVPLSQVSGMVRIQQQLKKLSVQRSLKTLRELLIESVEERRGQGADASSTHSVESWRLVATARFTSNRVVVLPWHGLVSLNLSHNKLTHLDESLQVLPSLVELNVSHNLLMVVDLQHLCLPSLCTINLCHNNINKLETYQLILEPVQTLNLSHNALTDLCFLSSFIRVQTLNVAHNMVAARESLSQLYNLKLLKSLSIKGNPIMGTHTARLVLLAKFKHKSRTVLMDGIEVTSREYARIQSLSHRHGPDPDHWPISHIISQIQHPTSLPLRAVSPPAPPSPSPIHLSWRIESTSSTPELRSPTSDSPSEMYHIQPTSHSPSTSTSRSSLCGEEVDHPLFANSIIILEPKPLSPESSMSIDYPVLDTRASPDGHSDCTSSSQSCEDVAATSPCIVSPPPCTPQLSVEDRPVQISPQMISAALEALTQAAASQAAASQATALAGSPPEEQHLPDLLSQALHSWISETSTPPPTPNQDGNGGQAVLAADLIAALSSVLSKHCAEGGHLSTGNSRAPSVPASTPQEGLGELARLGIQPEDVLHALNQLQVGDISPGGLLDGEEEDEKRTCLRRREKGEWTPLENEQTTLDAGKEKETEDTTPDREKGEECGSQELSQINKNVDFDSEQSIVMKEDFGHSLKGLGHPDEERKDCQQENI